MAHPPHLPTPADDAWTRTSADPRRLLLMQVGASLLGGGLATSDVEDELRALARDLGAPDARIAAWPNGLFVALDAADATGFEPVRGPLRADQTSDVLNVLEAIRTPGADPGPPVRSEAEGRRCAADALAALAAIRRSPPRWPHWVSDLGAVFVGAGLCLLLQPGVAPVLRAALASIVVAALSGAARRWSAGARLLLVASAFAVSLIVLSAFQAGWVDGPLRIIVAVLAILLPGSAVVTGLTEMASGDPAAGSSRLISATVQLTLFFAGLVGAAALLGVPLSDLGNVAPAALPWWAPASGIALATVGLVLYLYPPLRHIGWIVLAIAAAATVQVSLNISMGPAVGGLAGAVTAALVAIVISRLPGGPTWQVTFQGAFLIVAPGSFGFLSASQIHLGAGAGAGAITAIYTALSAFVAIAIGTLIGSVLARASDRVIRRRPAPLPAADGADRA